MSHKQEKTLSEVKVLKYLNKGGCRQYVRQLSFLGAQLLQTQDPATDKFPLTVRPVSSS